MKARLLRFLDTEHEEAGRVGLLLIMSFFMGVFLATISVASQTLFLEHFDEKTTLPVALLISGAFGLLATVLYNFLQNRIPFWVLSTFSLVVITILTAFIEFGEGSFTDPNTIFFFGFTLIIPFTFITYLVFWGSFTRLFNLRQSKRLVGTVDLGALLASFIAFFSIPQLLDPSDFVKDLLGVNSGIGEESLYTVALFSIFLFLVTFIYLSMRHLTQRRTFAEEKLLYTKVKVKEFVKNPYLLYMSLFVIVSMIALSFVDYSFLNSITIYTTQENLQLGSFISYIEMTIVIFSLLVQTLAADRILKEYGMRISVLINPILVGIFTIAALVLGYFFIDNTFVVFFMMIAIGRIFIRSLRDALDNPTFKLYLLPIESHIRIDAQTKIEGIVTAFASLVAGGLILLISRVDIFNLLSITMFTIPLILGWFIVANRMHTSYKYTLQGTLLKNKEKSKKTEKQYTVGTVLEKEVLSTIEEKVIYGLKLMEKLEPTLFENTIIRLSNSESRIIRNFAVDKIQAGGIQADGPKTEVRSLAEKTAGDLEDSDLLSISPEKLLRLSKSVKQPDRILAAKLLRKLIGPKTIFILLELLRDVDPKVRYEALLTARKVKRQETWPVLIELLASPSFSHYAAAALKEAGESVLPTLEAAFHKSGQNDMVMLRIVQIMGRVGGRYSLQLLWKKADYPDKRIVKQILYSLRFINYQAKGKEIRDVIGLLEAEMSKTIWNLAALHELPDVPEFFFLRQALQEEVTENYDQITMLLSIVYDPQSVQLVRENLETGDPDNIAFAMELLDLFIDQELKPKLLPLLDDISTPEKLERLQIYFPRESYNPIQVINYILNRDFNLNNRWSKACAIHASAYIQDFRISRGLVAQMFNSDKLLQETAAWVIYNKDRKVYETIAARLPERDKKFLDSSIENNRLLDGLNDGFFLWIEKVMFIKQLPAFANIHGTLLSDLADKIVPYDLDPREKLKLQVDDHNTPILITAHGEVKLRNNGNEVTVLKRGGIYGDLFHNGPTERINELEATERAVVFTINLMDFYFVLANHHELVQGLIKNITEENKTLNSLT
ncbi:MAG TPA: hypothetical protein VGK59_15300 [Ohtaekwangia sp.]